MRRRTGWWRTTSSKSPKVSSGTDTELDEAQAEWRRRFVAGPTRLRWNQLPPQVGDEAPDIELLDPDGHPTRLSTFWDDTPALLLFWRHNGCTCGFDRAQRLKDEYESYEATGAHVVVVGQAEPTRAKAYAAANSLPCPVLCDPEYLAYQAFGLREGDLSQVIYDAPEQYWTTDLDVWSGVLQERRELGRPLVDNPWQLPGEFVVAAGGTLKLAHHYNHCEDYPDPRVLLSALRSTHHRSVTGRSQPHRNAPG